MSRGVQRSDNASTCLYAPYEIPVLRNVRNTGTAKPPAQTLATCKKIRHTNFTLSANRRKNCIRNNSKGRERCKTYLQGDRILHSTFGKNKAVRYVSDKNSKNSTFETYRILAPKVF